MKVVAVLLAAGAGRRMGGLKQLAAVEGRTLLEQSLARLLESQVDEVVLVLGYGARALRERPGLDRARLRLVEAPDWEEGMAASLRAGVRAAGQADAILVALADMPWVPPEVVDALIVRAGQTERGIVAPFLPERRGHPVLFKRSTFEALLGLEGDRGAAALLERAPEDVEKVWWDDDSILKDVDRPQDLGALARVLLRGGGDLGSGAAHRLFLAGFPVLILELEQPRMIRGSVSFAQAAYEGSCRVEGVECRRVSEPPPFWRGYGQRPDWIPLLVDPEGGWLPRLAFDVLVDARMQKRAADTSASQARLVVALGPGFEAPKDAHYVIETQRGHTLGRVLSRGTALPDTGVPGSLGGESTRRVAHAPCPGLFLRRCRPGDTVVAGVVLGEVDGVPVPARMGGLLRGLLADGLRVQEGEKLADVDARSQTDLSTISDKSRAVAGGVLEAVMRWHFGGAGR